MEPIVDRHDSALALLTGPDVDDLLAAALAPVGGRILRWSLRDVEHRPGRRTTATYTADTSWPDGVRTETFGASVDPRRRRGASAPDDRLVVSDGDHTVEIWRFPYDPELPALADATIPAAVLPALRSMGVEVGDVRLRVVSYRPRKRAVIEADSSRGRFYVKVLRPSTLPDVRSRHDVLSAAGLPVAPVLAARPDGLLVLGELTGTPLRQAISARAEAALAPSEILAMLDRLPDVVRHLPRRKPWSEHAAHYAGVVASALPEVGDWAHALADAIAVELTGYGDGDEPTHGDFYEAQLIVGDGRITGLLDVDTVGPGRRADDLACLLGHLSILTVMSPDGAPEVARAMDAWQPVFERTVDPRELRTRAAGVILSLATGPFRARDADWEEATVSRLHLVERWLESTARQATST